jgi:hypothetical protein
MCRAGFLPDVAMMILLATVVVMDMCMLMGPASGWSDTIEYRLLSQLQLPFAENIIAYVLRKCENLVGVMVFGQKAYDNIMPWLRTHYSQRFLIQNVLLNHPQNIQWRYLLEHAQNYIETFRGIMNLLGVDIPPLEGVVQLRFLMTKKRTLDMMECVKEFVDSKVLEAVHQRTDKVKIARTAKVEGIMAALNSEEAAKAAKRIAKAAKCIAKEVAVVAAVAAQCKKMKQMTKSMAAVVAAVTQEMNEAVVGKCMKTKEMTISYTEVAAAVAQSKEMEEAAPSKAAFEAAAAAAAADISAAVTQEMKEAVVEKCRKTKEMTISYRNRGQTANRYPPGVFEKLDKWFPANDISKLYPSNYHKKRTVEALNGVITLLQVKTFCVKRREILSRRTRPWSRSSPKITPENNMILF